MQQQELSALINLLDDPDESIYSHIKGKIFSYGEDVIPMLENAWEQNSFGIVFQGRVEKLIKDIQFDCVFSELKQWVDEGGEDLMKGASIVTRYQYPDLDMDKFNGTLERIKQDIWLELNENLTALEKVKIINHILFDVHGFSGNTKNYHAPQNSYISDVVETKRGNPLSLCILYSSIAQSLKLPVFGINLPRHFILAYVTQGQISSLLNSDILFYINPFSKGNVFHENEVEKFLKELKLKPRKEYYQPCQNVKIIRRMVYNLFFSYEKLGNEEKVADMKKLLTAVSG